MAETGMKAVAEATATRQDDISPLTMECQFSAKFPSAFLDIPSAIREKYSGTRN